MFLFFGIVAVAGSYYVQTEELPALAFELAVPVGLLAAAILIVNNIRDIDTDRRAGKRTLAVRLGRERARSACTRRRSCSPILIVVVVVVDRRGEAWLLISPGCGAAGVRLVRTVGTRTDGPSLNAALAGTGRLLAVFSILLSAGLLLSG